MSASVERESWSSVPTDEVGDVVVAALAQGGVEYVFFSSGSDIMFFQEAVAKSRALGRNAPKLIVMTHEYAGLNAALGYSAVTGRPAATAAHVDVGTQHYGCALHTAWWAGLPVLITAGAPPVSYPGAMRGGRDGGHFWLQQTLDQNAIARAYTKWDHRLEYQDNPGLIVSRALQVAQSEPSGPVYLSFPREIALMRHNGAEFPSADELGIARPSAPDAEGVEELAARMAAARNPCVVVSRSGRDPETVPALVALCETLGMAVIEGSNRSYQCFRFNHYLYQGSTAITDADFVLVIDADAPWMPDKGPGQDAYVAVVGSDSICTRIPTLEFTANLRLNCAPLNAINALREAVAKLEPLDFDKIEKRKRRWRQSSAQRMSRARDEAQAFATKSPIDPVWLAFQIGEALDDNSILIDDTLSHNPLSRFLQCERPG
ncbi:MAG: hypothetical protein JO289_03750, partial [Xanthobacteraceae bacterium]|nr:hypothetical protein [Xanthobacteraceae bacterium]